MAAVGIKEFSSRLLTKVNFPNKLDNYRMAPKAKEATPNRKSGAKASAKNKKQAKHTTGAQKAGIVFPVGRIGRFIKQGRFSERFGKSAAVFMAATLEYLTSEILELAGNAAHEAGKKTIAPRHLQLAVRNDEELAKLMSATMIANGGYMSNIHPFLMQGKGAKGKKMDSAT